MCGINGRINSEKSEQELSDLVRSMNFKIQNRGPDGEGFVLGENFAIGHTRLAIVDSMNHEADQPMESGNYIISFNGEIYNHKELRKELENHGVNFETNCDTEVLLEGYKFWGKDVLDRLNGQFAFAVYDKETKETFLARDRTAMKPLYFSLEDGLQFSSDVSVIAKSIGFNPDLDSIVSLLINGSAFAAGEEPLGNSIYAGIKSLKPGEYMKVSADGTIERKKYYSLPIKDIDNPKSEKEYINDLRQTLESAIIKRIPDEVRLGCALSGGLDSSLITAIVANQIEDELTVACIRYTADASNPDYEHAKILASNPRYANVNLLSTDISPENFLDDLEEMVAALGIHDSIRQLGMFRNYKVLKENGVKVVLTGEGADEFNWGYWHKFPGLKCDQEACSTEEGFRELVSQRKKYVKQLINGEVDNGLDYLLDIYRSFETTDSTRKMMGVYAVDFLGFLNKANDRCSMANSLEARCPFQDVDVVETCLEIPQEYQIQNGTEKYILREAFKDVLPEEIYTRGKAPLPAAAHIEYHRSIAKEFEKRILSVDNSFWQYFNKDSFEKIAQNYNGKINKLENNCSAEEAGARLMEWRPIGGSCDIVNGDDIRTNDVFKLLTTIVWYNQNYQGGKNE
jgi:asparagine synthase (glutamine-hydrolysing)